MYQWRNDRFLGSLAILGNHGKSAESLFPYVDIVGVAGSIPAAPTILASESRRFRSVRDHGLGVSYCLSKPSTVPKTRSGGAMLGRMFARRSVGENHGFLDKPH